MKFDGCVITAGQPRIPQIYPYRFLLASKAASTLLKNASFLRISVKKNALSAYNFGQIPTQLRFYSLSVSKFEHRWRTPNPAVIILS